MTLDVAPDVAPDWMLAIVSAIGVGALSGALPVTVAEATALAAGSIGPLPLKVAVVIAFTAGHVAGKGVWYAAGTLESRVTHPRVRVWIERARGLATQHPRAGLGVIASSATISLPPFHLMAIAAGMVHSRPVPFFAIAFVGRLIRFGAIAASSSLVAWLWL